MFFLSIFWISNVNCQSLDLRKIVTDNGCIVFSDNIEIDRVTWSGSCIESLVNGKGVLNFYNTDGLFLTYEGETKDGYFDGQGIIKYSNGSTYSGEWKSNLRHGKGTYTYYGQKYVGEWERDKKNGIGTSTNSDGSKYTGEWKNNLKNGQGTYTYSNGVKYVGEWEDGLENGQGTITYFSGGPKHTGKWEDGKLIEETKQIVLVESSKNKSPEAKELDVFTTSEKSYNSNNVNPTKTNTNRVSNKSNDIISKNEVYKLLFGKDMAGNANSKEELKARVKTARRVICPTCRGNKTKKYTCTECEGRILVNCYQCKGQGDWNNQICKRCKGNMRVPCNNCNGTGKISCQTCYASGTILRYSN